MHLNRDGVKNRGTCNHLPGDMPDFFPALFFSPSLIIAVDPWTWCMDGMQLASIDKLRYNLFHNAIAEV